MKDTATLNPANHVAENSSADGVVLLRLSIEKHPLTELMWPSKNRVGMVLLADLLSARMEAAGITMSELPAYLGTLNHSFYSFTVSNPLAAAEVIKSEVLKHGLDGFAYIAWWDPAEGFYRVVHPGGSQFPAITQAEIDQAKKHLAENAAKREQVFKDLLRKWLDEN